MTNKFEGEIVGDADRAELRPALECVGQRSLAAGWSDHQAHRLGPTCVGWGRQCSGSNCRRPSTSRPSAPRVACCTCRPSFSTPSAPDMPGDAQILLPVPAATSLAGMTVHNQWVNIERPDARSNPRRIDNHERAGSAHRGDDPAGGHADDGPLWPHWVRDDTAIERPRAPWSCARLAVDVPVAIDAQADTASSDLPRQQREAAQLVEHARADVGVPLVAVGSR